MEELQLTPPTVAAKPVVTGGFWSEVWRRFRKRKLAMLALSFVVFLCLLAIFAPMIIGTKPIVCKYKGHIYFPCMGYYARTWENPIFLKDRFRNVYPTNLKKKRSR